MNVSKLFFKLIIIISYILRLMLITLPLTWILVNAKEGGWRYGFTFIQNNFEVALFVSFAISFLIALYHALSFDVIEGAPDENYLKTVQEVRVKGGLTIEDLAEIMQSNSQRYKCVELKDGSISASRKVHLLPPDNIVINKLDGLFQVNSRPFRRFWFIDFGRNFKNVKEIAKYIKFDKK